MIRRPLATVALALLAAGAAHATPANRASLAARYGPLLTRALDACTTCHRGDGHGKVGATLAQFPHNAFGDRLRAVAVSLRAAGKPVDLEARLAAIAREDSDADGVANEDELLLGAAPGDKASVPSPAALAQLPTRRQALARQLSSYRWRPFARVVRPPLPPAPAGTNPVDAFLDASRSARRTAPRPPAPRALLLRRLTLDLTGLLPTPEEIDAFVADRRPDAYARQVDRLLASPAYSERWARHFMDIWRYSDWAGWNDGGQIRDSQPHIWRWRDWIVESLQADKGYDQMVREMLAADELLPGDTQALRATGFLVRNFKLLSREQWLEDTVNHTAKAFLGVTMHCAKCHDHMYDPISQVDYYRFRAIFEPHQVRIDRVPGQPDTGKDGLALAFDADPKAPTYFFPRGDERRPDKTRPLEPGVPEALGGALQVAPVALPRSAYQPDRRDFVVREALEASEATLAAAWQARAERKDERTDAAVAVAEARHQALLAVLSVERLEEAGKSASPEWGAAARWTVQAQRAAALAEAQQALLLTPNGKREALQKALADAQAAQAAPLTTAYTPRVRTFPASSTGRRAALARWLTDAANPLTARVAVNHVFLRHFGQALAPSVADFGRNGQRPLHPQLLDYLASEFMAHGWSLQWLHRQLVTSRAYRLDSRPDPAMLAKDPDNRTFWRFAPRRLEAEAIRDNVLFAAGSLDPARGGPEEDHNAGLTSRRRSLYLRHAAEKQAEFLQIFDAPSVTECYERKPSVMPQQALALANSALAVREARILAQKLATTLPRRDDAPAFVAAAFLRLLSRPPTPDEAVTCLRFLATQPPRRVASAAAPPGLSLQRRYENLVLVLFNHHEFVTVR